MHKKRAPVIHEYPVAIQMFPTWQDADSRNVNDVKQCTCCRPLTDICGGTRGLVD